MEKVHGERESELPVGRLIADMRLRELRRFQCRVCSYTFAMSPCAHGLCGKDLTCPQCGGRLKKIDGYGCEGHCSLEDCEVCGKCER